MLHKGIVVLSLFIMLVAGCVTAKKVTTVYQSGDSIIAKSGALILHTTGLPAQMLTDKNDAKFGNNLLAEPVHFHVVLANGKELKFTNKPYKFTKTGGKNSTIEWANELKNDTAAMYVTGSSNFNNEIRYGVKILFKQDVQLKNITFHIPVNPAVAKEVSGFGGGLRPRPDTLQMNWGHNDNGYNNIWMGDENGGLRYFILNNKNSILLNNNLQSNWVNDNQGGEIIALKGKSVLIENYTGPINIHKGEALYFPFVLQIQDSKMAKEVVK